MTYQAPICKNDRCSNLVGPSKNPGKDKVFCSARCSRRYHARLAYQREAGKEGGGLVFVNALGQAQVNRRISLTAKAAEQRYKSHLDACALHGGPCPARSDPYGRQKRCIVAATFADDWSQLKDAEEGRPVKRFSTTVDGRWFDDLSSEEREAIAKRAGTADTYMTPEARKMALEAGAGSREQQEDSALARYNEGLPFAN